LIFATLLYAKVLTMSATTLWRLTTACTVTTVALFGGVADADLIAYYPLDGDATAVIGTDGTLQNGASAGVDRNGSAGGGVSFDGSSQQYASITDSGLLTSLNSGTGTFSTWVAWNGTQDVGFGDSYGAVLARQQNGLESAVFAFLDDPNPANADVSTRPYGPFTSSTSVTGGGPVGDGTYRHVVYSMTSGEQKLYVDGELVGTTSIVDTPAFTTNPPLTLGAWIGDGGSYSTSTMDEFGFFDTTLSEGKAKALYFAAIQPELQYAVDEIDQLFEAYDTQSEVQIGNLVWEFASTADLTAAGLLGPEGEITTNDGSFGLLLDTAVGGLIGQAVPEPASLLGWVLVGFVAIACRSRRTRR
jgi:hypothetical protein